MAQPSLPEPTSKIKRCSVLWCRGNAGRIGLCVTHHLKEMKGKPPEPRKRGRPRTYSIRTALTREQHFWAKVKKRSRKKCWIWQGCTHPVTGYGRARYGGKTVYAHRIAFEIHNGYAPTLMVLHSCDNPPCVNPAHLREGTAADNMRDRDERGRGAWQRDPVGWAKRMAKVRGRTRELSDETVDDIRRRYAAGESARTLAQAFKIDYQRIPKIAHGKLYRLDREGNPMPLYPPSERVHKLFRDIWEARENGKAANR